MAEENLKIGKNNEGACPVSYSTASPCSLTQRESGGEADPPVAGRQVGDRHEGRQALKSVLPGAARQRCGASGRPPGAVFQAPASYSGQSKRQSLKYLR